MSSLVPPYKRMRKYRYSDMGGLSSLHDVRCGSNVCTVGGVLVTCHAFRVECVEQLVCVFN